MIVSFGEEAITQLVTNDNIEMFYFFYKKYYKNIYLNILKLVQLPQSAEDILQDVFLTFWENRNKLSSEQSISGWLFVVSHSKSLSYLKKKAEKLPCYLIMLPYSIKLWKLLKSTKHFISNNWKY